MIDSRYRIESELGVGGTAVVYQVFDGVTGQHLALKRLADSCQDKPRVHARLRDEYQTLKQLAHPHIVEAREFGLDGSIPYYTMELVEGRDLGELAPADWKPTCGILRDLASALALLHSRSLVHRDLSTRNVRCTEAGQVKLIDFDAMMPFGRAQALIGTPPFIAPETLRGQNLDQRVDLYALGVLAYWLLTAYYPYDVEDVGSLREAWSVDPVPLVELLPDIPRELSALIGELLSLDHLARPASAAEVISRLSALADLTESNRNQAQRAYLVTPTLVGRAELLELARGLPSAQERSVLLVEGAPGMGRSRALAACELELRVAGVTVLRAAGSDAARPFEAARQLVKQVLEARTELRTKHAGSAPGGDQPVSANAPGNRTTSREAEMAYVTGVLSDASADQPVVVSIDDLHLLDEPSLALLAGLATQPGTGLRLLLSADPEVAGTSQRAINVLRGVATVYRLASLDAGQTRTLLASVFGEIPRIALLGEVMQQVHGGNPRAIMNAAQRLVDMRLARYRDGRWFLVNETATLISCVEQLADVGQGQRDLPPDAAELLAIIALDRHHRLQQSDYPHVCGDGSPERIRVAVSSLTRSRLLGQRNGRYVLRPGDRAEVLSRLSPDKARELHRRIAERCGLDREAPIYEAYHAVLGEDLERAHAAMGLHLDRLEAQPGGTRQAVDLDTLKTFVQLGIERNWPASLLTHYRTQLILTAASRGEYSHVPPIAAATMEALCHFCKLPGHETLRSSDPDRSADAQDTADRPPLSPEEAVSALARVGVLVAVAGFVVAEPVLFSVIPDLSPLGRKWPLIDATERLIDYLRCRAQGQGWHTRPMIEEVYAKVKALSPDAVKPRARFALEYVALSAMCAVECRYAGPKSLEYCDLIMRFEPHIAEGYRAVYHAANGDLERAKQARRRVEAIALRAGSTRDSRQEMMDVATEVHVMADDLIELKRVAEELEDEMRTTPGLVFKRDRVRGHVLRLCGRLDEAQAMIESSLQLLPVQHVEWVPMVEALLRVLNARGASDLALRRGLNYRARAHRFHMPTVGLDLALADTLAAVDAHDAALDRWQTAVEAMQNHDVGGLHLGYAYEVGARIALLRGDPEAFEQSVVACGQYYLPGRHPALVAKHERLRADARQRERSQHGTSHLTQEAIERKRSARRSGDDPDARPAIPTLTMGATGATLLTGGATESHERFELTKILGRGGLGEVFEVVDRQRGESVALKRLFGIDPDGDGSSDIQRLLETEFHTLKQLQHPSIIAAYDYGVDPTLGPYYTMELLSGEDLTELSPLPWQEVCALLTHVASSLAVVHSRGLVHRDVTAANVRRTPDGRAKLLDFGALMEKGPPQHEIGTPAYMPPESLGGGPIDGRADLYSLGALAYFALTGRHAYPAARMRDLEGQWGVRPPGVCQLDPSIPAELGELVTALMQPDPLVRPQTAAEVMTRLGAIAGVSMAEDASVQYAYLHTPRLVGRRQALGELRGALDRATDGYGGVFVIEGRAGTGRTRLVQACGLEAQLLGLLVVSADAREEGADFGVARQLTQQLLERASDLQVDASIRAWMEDATLLTRRQREELLTDLHRQVVKLSKTRPIALMIDDMDRIDEPSSALLANLAMDASEHALCLIVSRAQKPGGELPLPMQLISQHAETITVGDLDEWSVGTLLASVFGDIPNLDLACKLVHDAFGGNPRDVMDAAHRLVAERVARYDAGSWLLADDAVAIRACIEASGDMARRLEPLSSDARELLATLALDRDQRVNAEDYASVAEHGDPQRSRRALAELVREHLIARSGGGHQIVRPGERNGIVASLDHSARRALHKQLALYCQKNRSQPIYEAHHWACAGEAQKAHDAMRAYIAIDNAQPDRVRHLIELETIEMLVSAGEAHGWPTSQLTRYRILLVRICGILGRWERIPAHAPATLEALANYCGLNDYWALSDRPAEVRLKEAIAQAQARSDACDAAADPMDPAEAIRALPRVAMVTAIGARYHIMPELSECIPDFEPLTVLSRALSFSHALVENYGCNLLRGATWQSWDTVRAIYDEIRSTSEEELDASARFPLELASLSGVCTYEAQYATKRALAFCDAIAHSLPDMAENYRSLYHLAAGDLEASKQARRRFELLSLRSGATDEAWRRRQLALIDLYSLVGDMIGLKRLLEELQEVTKVFPGWRFKVERVRLRTLHCQGRLEEAIAGVEEVLRELPAVHEDWSSLAELHILLLVETRRAREAAIVGSASLARARELGAPVARLELAHAQALALQGDAQGALRTWESAHARLQQRGVGGILMGYSHEVEALLALHRGDLDGFDRAAQRSGEYYLPGKYPALAARHERLLERARTARSSDRASSDSKISAG